MPPQKKARKGGRTVPPAGQPPEVQSTPQILTAMQTAQSLESVWAVILVRDSFDAQEARVLLENDEFPRYGEQLPPVMVVAHLVAAAKARAENKLREEVDEAVLVYDFNPTDKTLKDLKFNTEPKLRASLVGRRRDNADDIADDRRGMTGRHNPYFVIVAPRQALEQAQATQWLDEVMQGAMRDSDPLAFLGEQVLGADRDTTALVTFAAHDFARPGFDETPSKVGKVLQSWEDTLRSLMRDTIRGDVNKCNPLHGLAAAPGSGKSHFLDATFDSVKKEEFRKKMQDNFGFEQVVPVRLNINRSWTFIPNVEDNWAVRQQIIARILCIAMGSPKWRAFAERFAASPLMQLSLRDLIGLFPANSLVIIFVDETLLVRGADCPAAAVAIETLLYEICKLGDDMVADRERRRVLSLFTALHAAHIPKLATGARRPLRLFKPDILDPRVVIPKDIWDQIVHTQGSNNTETAFAMCSGHPRSLVRIQRQMQNRVAPVAHINDLIHGLGQPLQLGVMAPHTTIHSMCPVLLDMLIPGRIARNGVASMGLMLVAQGFYTNSFAVSELANFIPTTMAWQLEQFLEIGSTQSHGCGVQGIGERVVEYLAHTRFALRVAMVDTRPTNLDGFLSRALHLRLEAFRAIPDTLQKLGQVDKVKPTVTLVSTGERSASAQRVGLFEVPYEQTHRLAQLQNAEIVQLAKVKHVTCWQYPSDDIERLLSESAKRQSTVILPNRQANAALDGAAHLWLKFPRQRQLEELKELIQIKQGGRSYLSRRLVRIALHKLQVLAKASFPEEERVVLVLALVCTEEEDIDIAGLVTAARLSDRYHYTDNGTRKSLPAIKYPVIVLGREDVFKMLGRSFATYLHQRFVGSLQPDEEQDLEHVKHDDDDETLSTFGEDDHNHDY